jgi:hypothetical protein
LTKQRQPRLRVFVRERTGGFGDAQADRGHRAERETTQHALPIRQLELGAFELGDDGFDEGIVATGDPGLGVGKVAEQGQRTGDEPLDGNGTSARYHDEPVPLPPGVTTQAALFYSSNALASRKFM